jgi:hypothetical protein
LLQHRNRRGGHAEIQPALADRLNCSHRPRTARYVDIEPELVPKTHTLCDKGEQIAAFGDSRKRRLDDGCAMLILIAFSPKSG